MERYKRKVESEADKVLAAHFRRLFKDNAVGERAFVTLRDTLFGVPAQRLVVEQDGGPLGELMAQIAAVYQQRGLALPAGGTGEEQVDGEQADAIEGDVRQLATES